RYGGRPAGLDHDRLVAFDDQSGTDDAIAGLQGFATMNAGLSRTAFEMDVAGLAGDRVLLVERVVRLVAAMRPRVGALYLDGFDHHRLVFVDKAELRLVRGFEGLPRARQRTVREVDRKRGVGAVIADMQLRPPGGVLLGNALGGEFVQHLRAQ